MQYNSEPRYINTSEVHRFNDNGQRTRVPINNRPSKMKQWSTPHFLHQRQRDHFQHFVQPCQIDSEIMGIQKKYRQEIHTLRKYDRETIQEYASRVEMLVRKSFPTIDTATHSTLSVEYMLRGLPDQSIAIELLTKRISSITEVLHQITLYETYKRGSRDRNIRQLGTIENDYRNNCRSEDIEVRTFTRKRFVTEERLTSLKEEFQSH
ncbi:unnamed protein product [Mytilus edulis]|uniref:Retrotransposon gag domain-containing protein n=1 Tax=Mytilus edulis TaxID=6550 RepID=A0A8S3VKI7_MYTED|nr:unnamed protein product [Mytilus edulis]